MKTIKIEKLTAEAFAPYGTFADVVNPSTPSLGSDVHTFYRDASRYFCDFSLPIGFSPITVVEHGLEVDAAEYHNRSCEAIMPVTGDAIVHVSPANGGVYDVNQTKAFLVPKGTIITLYPGVWHLMPLPVDAKEVNCLIVLPERAYVNDFSIVDLDEDNKFVMEF